MSDRLRYVHTNLIAHDWRRLARFYIEILHCTPLLPERNLEGDWLAEATGVPEARIQGIHLQLPGYGDQGPTLELFEYAQAAERPATTANRPGFGHLAFEVPDVEALRDEVIAAGGGALGATVCREIPDVGTITFAYLTDPEGNIIELQSWS